MSKVMVIGAGTMGSGIAQVFATHGWDVVLNDIKDEFIAGGKAKIEKQLTKQVSKGKMTQEDKDATMARISGFVTRTADNMKDIDLVVEAAIEDLKIKSAIFKELDELCRNTRSSHPTLRPWLSPASAQLRNARTKSSVCTSSTRHRS